MIVFIIVLLILSPLFYWRIRQKQIEKDYLNTLHHKLNNKNFFCYNNRKQVLSFIEENLIPQLSNKIELIKLEGRVPQSDYAQLPISKLLYRLQNYTKFPHLIKIRNGQVIDQSINNEFFNTFHQGKPTEHLLVKIETFFED